MFFYKWRPQKKSQGNCENNFKLLEISWKNHILNISGMKKNILFLCYGKESLMGNLLECHL